MSIDTYTLTRTCGATVNATVTRSEAYYSSAAVDITDPRNQRYLRTVIVGYDGRILSDATSVTLTDTVTGDPHGGMVVGYTAHNGKRWSRTTGPNVSEIDCHRVLDTYGSAAKMVIDTVRRSVVEGRI